MSLILAVSTSFNVASVAIIKAGALLSERILDENTHSSTLMPAIDELFVQHGVTAKDLDVIAVDTGPGSFTGVRIGVSTANGIAFGANKPVVGVTSLLALRYAVNSITQRHIATIIDAHNDRVYAAIYLGQDTIIEPYATDIEEFMSKLPQDSICIGSGAYCHRSRLTENFPAIRCFCEPEHTLSARHVGLAAYEQLLCGKVDVNRFSQAEPTYLKLSQAELMHKPKEVQE